MKKNGELRTSDFYIAAYALASGGKISYVDRTNLNRVVFVFGNIEDPDGLVRDFLYRRGRVEPQAFVDAIKSLKGLIYHND